MDKIKAQLAALADIITNVGTEVHIGATNLAEYVETLEMPEEQKQALRDFSNGLLNAANKLTPAFEEVRQIENDLK